MTASKESIREWVYEGVEKGATHVIIAVDRFDHDNYPIYVMDNNPREHLPDESNMQGYDEVYNLSMDVETQLKEPERVRNF